jgi:hypothetical protein
MEISRTGEKINKGPCQFMIMKVPKEKCLPRVAGFVLRKKTNRASETRGGESSPNVLKL